MNVVNTLRLTPKEAMRIAGPGGRRVGVLDADRRFIGYEVLDGTDLVVARFKVGGEQVDRLLPENADIPLPPPRGSRGSVP